MTPIHSSSFDAITRAVSRHYLRPLSLEPVPGEPDRWTVCIMGRTEPVRTEVVHAEGRYTFQDAPARKVPDWDREIPNETNQ